MAACKSTVNTCQCKEKKKERAVLFFVCVLFYMTKYRAQHIERITQSVYTHSNELVYILSLIHRAPISMAQTNIESIHSAAAVYSAQNCCLVSFPFALSLSLARSGQPLYEFSSSSSSLCLRLPLILPIETNR